MEKKNYIPDLLANNKQTNKAYWLWGLTSQSTWGTWTEMPSLYPETLALPRS